MAAPLPAGRCPECGSQTERVTAAAGGCIEDLYMTGSRTGELRRVVRPASYYACTGCEWCSEDAPLEWLRTPSGEDGHVRAAAADCSDE